MLTIWSTVTATIFWLVYAESRSTIFVTIIGAVLFTVFIIFTLPATSKGCIWSSVDRAVDLKCVYTLV